MRAAARATRFAPAVVVTLLAGCAVAPPGPPAPQPAPPTAPVRPSEAVPRPTAPPSTTTTPPSGSREATIAAARRYAAQGRKAINARTTCRFSDEQGYSGRLDLQVDNDDVKRLSADVSIPRHGNCHFALNEFRQAGQRPGVLLNSQAGSCTVRMWEQGPRLSVAFANCAAHCNGGAHEYLWPILVDTRTGECS